MTLWGQGKQAALKGGKVHEEETSASRIQRNILPVHSQEWQSYLSQKG